MKFKDGFKKGTAILSAFFFLSAQPVWANPFLPQELEDDDTQSGFVDAERAEESRQRQEREVDQMRDIFDDSNDDPEPSGSILSKFQDTDEQTKDGLEQAAKESEDLAQDSKLSQADTESDVALLGNTPTPLPQVDPVETEEAEDRDGKEEAKQTESDEETGSQAVAAAEIETPSEQSNEETETVALKVLAADSSASESDTSSEGPDSTVTVESFMADEEPVVLAALSVAPPAPIASEVLGAEVDSAAREVSQARSDAVATELAALMPGVQVGAVSAQSEAVAVSAMEGNLPQGASVPAPQPFLQEDPPALLIPIAPIDGSDLFNPGEDGTGGVSRVGTVFDAFKTFFQDLNTGNGQAIGNGVSDSAETFSEFVDFIAFIYSTFFNIDINPGELKELLLNGTTEAGVQLFGSETVFLNALIVSAFFLQTSDFFPSTGREGVDLGGLRGDNADAFSFSIPFILPDYVVTALGQAIDPNASASAANALGLNALNSRFAELFSLTLSLQPGNGFFIVDPNNLSNVQAFMSDSPLDFDQNVNGFISVNFISAGDAEFDPTLLNLIQANGNQTGLAGFFKITIDKATLDFIGDLMVNAFLANLGPALDFYDRLGFPTGVGPNAPFIFMPGLFTLTGGVNQGFQGAQSGLAFAVLQMLFSTGLSFLTLFGMAPPIPNISTMDINGTSRFAETEENAQESFEGIEERAKSGAVKSTTKEEKGKDPDKDKDKDKKGKKAKGAKKAAPGPKK